MERRPIVKAMTAVSLVLLGFSTVQMFTSPAARAAERDCQRWEQDWWRSAQHERCLRAGTIIPARIASNRRIILRRWENYPLNLRVTRDVRGTYSRRIVIPAGSNIRGRLIPYRSWYRFEAERIRFPSNQREEIDAVSPPLYISDRYDQMWGGDRPLVSDAASILLNTLLGRRFEGYDAFALRDIFNRYPRVRRDLVVVYPRQDIDLRLTRSFVRD
jgi:hypothetical protein